MRLLFDIETTPIPDDPRKFPDKIWCMVVKDLDSGQVYKYADDQNMYVLTQRLLMADLIVGHNISRFDVPVLEEAFGVEFDKSKIYDTLVASRLTLVGTIRDRVKPLLRERFPKEMWNAGEFHSLKAWGIYLDFPKTDFDDFSEYSEDMLAYCTQDVELNAKVWERLTTEGPFKGSEPVDQAIVQAESEVAYIIGLQERNGVGYDRKKAAVLNEKLQTRRAELEGELVSTFGSWTEADGKVACYKDRSLKPSDARPWRLDRGGKHQKFKRVVFNPSSSQHRYKVLHDKYGWEPTDRQRTDTGQPSTSENVLSTLPYPEVEPMLEYMMLAKKIGQISDGDNAWDKLVSADGLIFGRVNTCGARTTRMSHSKPNLAQVPKVGKPWGRECRELFCPTRPDWVMVGADASSLQYRMLAHRAAQLGDGGELTKIITEGDFHESTRIASGLHSRANQKTFNYALLFGAGNTKLGSIVVGDYREAGRQSVLGGAGHNLSETAALGEEFREKILRGIPGLGLVSRAAETAFERGYIRGLDGRPIVCRSRHGAINDLLQSDEAVVMKYALIDFFRKSHSLGETNYRFLLNVHDEIQIECPANEADFMGRGLVGSIRKMTEKFNLLCPLEGEYKVGNNWAETH